MRNTLDSVILANLHQFELRGEDVVRVSTGLSVNNLRPDNTGYLRVCVRSNGKCHNVLFHRLKYALAHGSLPGTVDHIDGDVSNNSLSNLRPATMQQQTRNKGRYTRKSGCTLPRGVYRRGSRFEAKVSLNGTVVSLGRFDSPEEASRLVEGMLSFTHGCFYRPHSH